MERDAVVDPLELCKNPKVIKDAQEEIGKLDVLVCGECHDVFHFIEPFQEHRQNEKCTKISVVRENYKHEPKAQVWAFMLWKNAQLKKTKEGENAPTSWVVYQRWCKLNTEEKDAWVAAGQTIQSFTKISAAKVQEIKAKTQTPVTAKNKIPKSIAQEGAKNDDDPLEEGEIRLSQLTNAQRVAIKAQVASNKGKSEVDPLADAEGSEMDSKGPEKAKKGNDAPKKTPFKPVQLNSEVTVGLKKSSELRKALRTGKNDSPEEAVVERILSRRFNHKKKCMEYFIKWESFNETENTWEPKHHLEKCKTLLDEFDRVFNKPKSGSKLTKQIDESHSEHSEAEELTPGSRPQRTSKQKALNQVKVWCGDITGGDDTSGKRKSFSDDDDSSDSFEKKIKLEEETDSSDDEKPSVTIRRVVKAPNSVNGVAKKPSETGFATSTPHRVVRVSQKQLPSLSSGVYIMSKTEGIIKLDSNTPPAGSPLLRVGPKIGQTHIKVVKKETGSPSNIIKTPVKPVPKLIKTSEPRTSLTASKTLTKVPTQQRRIPGTPIKPLIKIIESNPHEKLDLNKQNIEDEDSDGLEELAFPTDLPLPSPDSPPGDFTLCPLTGKILGQTDEPMEQEEAVTENTSLDILVKQAVAELPDVDMDTSTLNVKVDDGDKSNETALAAPIISISAAPVDSVSVLPVDSVNVSSIVSITTASDASSSASPAITIITTSAVAASTRAAPISVVATPSVTATPSIPVAVTPATSVNVISKTSGRSKTAISTPIISNSKIATKDDIEERLPPTTIEKNNPKEGLITVTKSRPVAAGTSILNAALMKRVPQNPNRVGPPKKLLSTTPHTVRQKVTTVNRSPINRPTVPRPSPNTTIIHKLTPNKNRTVLPKAVPHQEPILKRTSNVTTYKPANVARRIGNTTIYKTSEKPQTPIKTMPVSSSAPIVTAVTPIVQPTLIPTAQTVINMPLLTTDEEPSTTSENVEPLNEIESIPNLPAESGLADLSTFSLPDSETPLLITGDDGTIYQVAGQNEEGQTILISEGPDGQQQCVLVSSETTNEEVSTLMMGATAATESEELEQTLMVSAPAEEVETEGGDGEESQVVAQIIKADPPSPGGTRKVVLMLPDGNLMMTDVTAEQYAALELDK